VDMGFVQAETLSFGLCLNVGLHLLFSFLFWLWLVLKIKFKVRLNIEGTDV
jgi:hypothetical protein